MQADRQTKVRKIRDVRIPMRDGITLGANLYLPEAEGKYPGIFSFYPYLKDGWIGIDHEPHHVHFASQGYAVMQVDFRGTGTSEGRNPHPFDLQERQDGFDIVEWMAQQQWCTGAIGIWGISYGGITSLSIASTQPPHLRAIIQVDGTFDNYEWLLRTHGCRGLLLADVDWGTRMAACNLLPPLFADPEGEWIGKWRERLSGSSPWFMDWHGKPPSADFWTSRPIPLEKIKVPTFSISGWYDAYTAPAFRVFEKVNAPARVLIGPWKHVLPDLAPQWQIGGLHEMVRWWDRWLKDIPNGVDKEPPVSIFVQGRNSWRLEAEWPIARTTRKKLYLSSGGTLSSGPPRQLEKYQYEYDPRVGIEATGYNGHRLHLEIPTDQSADDHASLVFTGSSLDQDIEITGEPTTHVALTADTGEMTLVAKLCVVDEQGRSRMISRGNVNPARRDAHAKVDRLQAGKVRRVSIPMHPTSVLVRAGERLRLCLAGADFPELWPTPNRYTMTVHNSEAGECYIDLPVVPHSSQAIEPVFEPARIDVGMPQTHAAGFDEQFDMVHRRLDSRSVSFETRLATRHLLDDATVLRGSHWGKVSTDADRPGTTSLRTETQYELQRPSGAVTVRVESLITHFEIQCDAQIKLDGGKFWEMTWHKQLNDWTEEK